MAYRFLECPRCQSEIRLRPKEEWARCRFCSHEFDPAESADPEWAED